MSAGQLLSPVPAEDQSSPAGHQFCAELLVSTCWVAPCPLAELAASAQAPGLEELAPVAPAPESRWARALVRSFESGREGLLSVGS